MTKEEKVNVYKSIIKTAGLELKGKNNLYTSVNGHMFSFFGKSDIVAVRLPKDEQVKFIEKYKTPYPVKQYGANMKDYVELPDQLLKDIQKTASYFKQSLKYAKSLKPKSK